MPIKHSNGGNTALADPRLRAALDLDSVEITIRGGVHPFKPEQLAAELIEPALQILQEAQSRTGEGGEPLSNRAKKEYFIESIETLVAGHQPTNGQAAQPNPLTPQGSGDRFPTHFASPVLKWHIPERLLDRERAVLKAFNTGNVRAWKIADLCKQAEIKKPRAKTGDKAITTNDVMNAHKDWQRAGSSWLVEQIVGNSSFQDMAMQRKLNEGQSR